jgi:hypothetical protein
LRKRIKRRKREKVGDNYSLKRFFLVVFLMKKVMIIQWVKMR